MITTKTRSIKANKDLMDKFEKKARKQGGTFNSRVVELMAFDIIKDKKP